jgi:hypothetical protein
MMSVPSRVDWINVTDSHSTMAQAEECFPGVEDRIPPLKDIPPHVMARQLLATRPHDKVCVVPASLFCV